MSGLQSNTDAILVAIPMVAVLFIGFFRLDELLSRPQRPTELGRSFSRVDQHGNSICIEPDGKAHRWRAVRSVVKPLPNTLEDPALND
jgi:hypothetical protein